MGPGKGEDDYEIVNNWTIVMISGVISGQRGNLVVTVRSLCM